MVKAKAQRVPIVEAVDVTATERDTTKVRYTTMEIPTGPLPGYLTDRIDVARMSHLQARALSAITSGLQFKQAKLKDGTKVTRGLHAIKWILERLEFESLE